MFLPSMLYDTKISLSKTAVAAGTSDQDGAVLDMSGWEGVVFILATGDVTSGSVISIHALENTASSTSSPTPTEVGSAGTGDFTAGASDADDKLLVLDVKASSMSKRYLFPRVKRTTQNAVINALIAIQYRAKTLPTTQPSEVIKSARI